jgi:23S rRNA (uracil1939-C5)-methyltransferase
MGLVELEAEKLVGGGSALAHHEGATWLVSGALPGEVVAAEATGRRAGVSHARTVEVRSQPHPARAADPCPHSDSCGGCDWPHVQALAGAALKREVAAGAARTHPGLAEQLQTASVRPSDLAYRLRARLHWDPQRATLGFFERRSWRVCEISNCRIVSPALRRTLPQLAAALAGRCAEPVDVEWLEDLDGTEAVMALRPAARGPQELAAAWVPGEGELPRPVVGAQLLSRSGRLRHGWGQESVGMALPVRLEVPVGAFFQGNRHLIRWLFERVGELAAARPLPTWDLHAGVGFLAAAAWRPPAAGEERHLVLVEPYREAARAAARNLPRARVVVGRTAEAYLGRCGRLPRTALAITDPPRAGLSRGLANRLAGWHPQVLLQLACDPSTWARDTAFLLDRGYTVRHLELVDLFPSTHHVEIVAVLEAR